MIKFLPALALIFTGPLSAKEEKSTPDQALVEHAEKAEKLADDQDSLSADVQDLIDSQTNTKVIELLSEVETLMAEAVDDLEQFKTGGETIAIETEIIEKIFEAAQEKSKSQGKGEKSPQNQAMLDMMQRMMGKEPSKGKPGEKKDGEKPGGQEGSDGQKGDSDAANEAQSSGAIEGNTEVRRVPKAAGKIGAGLPQEFQKALDAYNRRTP